jgi:hypothetical protein
MIVPRNLVMLLQLLLRCGGQNVLKSISHNLQGQMHVRHANLRYMAVVGAHETAKMSTESLSPVVYMHICITTEALPAKASTHQLQ